MKPEEKKELVAEIIAAIKDEFWLTPKVKEENLKANVPALLDMVINEIAVFYDVSSESIKGKWRKGIIPQCKQIYFYIAKNHINTHISLNQIAKHINPNSSHCNAIYGIKTLQDRMETEREIQKDVWAIIELVKRNL